MVGEGGVSEREVASEGGEVIFSFSSFFGLCEFSSIPTSNKKVKKKKK